VDLRGEASPRFAPGRKVIHDRRALQWLASSGRPRGQIPDRRRPRWSPTGEWIACTSIEPDAYEVHLLYRIRPDGTGRSRIGPGISVLPSFAWSRDGAWLAVAGGQGQEGYTGVGLSLVQLETGLVIPLHHRHALIQPTCGDDF
jgi:hypothetical protein